MLLFVYVTALVDVAVVVSAVADDVVVIPVVVISDIFLSLLMNALHWLLSGLLWVMRASALYTIQLPMWIMIYLHRIWEQVSIFSF